MLLFYLHLLLSPPSSLEASKTLTFLSHKRFQVRQKAQIKLESLGEKARNTLEIGCKSRDPEVKRRCQELLGKLDEAKFKSLGSMPMIDSMWWLEAQKRYIYDLEAFAEKPYYPAEGLRFQLFVHYLENRGRDYSPWNNYCFATEDLIRDCMKWKIPLFILKPALREMRRRDQLFLNESHRGVWPGRPWYVPLKEI